MSKKAKIIIPLPNHDFDPSEVAIPWQVLTSHGYEVVFATLDGQQACADPIMITGEGLDFWGWIPLLKKIRLCGLLLRADAVARSAYKQLEQAPEFIQPITFAELNPDDYAGLLLPGGHAPGVKVYFENQQLQQFTAHFFEQLDDNGEHKPVGAVCHGVLMAARAISSTTGRSVLHGKKTTALTWQFEQNAWNLTRFFLRFWDPHYYRTYGESTGEAKGHWSVEAEVTRALAHPDDFLNVPKDNPDFKQKTSGMARDRLDNDKPAWVVQDGNYLSARWPGDVHTLALKFVEVLEKSVKG
jgi:putative intracellular protease/amidase